ncbi:MAG: putative ABC transporter permease [Lachnospiraceae bacterium]
MSVYYFMLSFFIYGFLGWCTEVAYAAAKQHTFVNRGFLNGPICPIYGVGVGIVVQFLTPYRSNIILLYVTSVVLVTVLEWVTGLILEKVFHNKWWDYSHMPLNLNGYVCLLFSLIWGVACVLIVDFIHPIIEKGLAFIPQVVGIVLLLILSFAMIADLYVTVAGILKMNKRLAKMNEIVTELHIISEQIGTNIYHGVMDTIERQEEFKNKTENVSAEVKEQIAMLKKNYQELSTGYVPMYQRLIKAFPRMESRNYQKPLEDLRNFLDTKKKNSNKKSEGDSDR